MNGIDGFLGKPTVVLDARVPSTGAKASDAAGLHGEPGRGAAFGGHLADLSRQDRKASGSTALASRPNPAAPPLVQQGFLLIAGRAEAAGQDTSAPDAEEPDVLPVIASPQANSNTPADANIAGLPVIGPREMLAMVSDPGVAGGEPGAQKDPLPERAGAPGGDAPCMEGQNAPGTGDPLIKAFRDSRTHAVHAEAKDLMTSPLLLGLPSPCAFTAASQIKQDISNETAAFGDTANCGTTGVPEATGEKVSRVAPFASVRSQIAAGRPQPQPDLSLRERPAEPHGPTGMQALFNGRSFGAMTTSAAFQTPAPAAGEAAPGLAASDKPAPASEGIAPVRADAQPIAGPRESLTDGPSGGHGFNFASPAPVGQAVVNQQTHLVPPHRLSPSQQLAHTIQVPAPAPAAGEDAPGLAASDKPAPASEGIAPVRVDAQPIARPRESLAPGPSSGHGFNFASPAPVGRAVVTQQTHLVPPHRLSPSQQLAHTIQVPAPAPAEDAPGLAASDKPASASEGIAPVRADAQPIAGPLESLTDGPSGGHGFGYASPAPVGRAVVIQQTHLVPPHRYSPSQQLSYPIQAPPPVTLTGDARGFASSGEPDPVSKGSAPKDAIARENLRAHAPVAAGENEDHVPVTAAPAQVRRLAVTQLNDRPASNSISPAQQIASFVVSKAGPDTTGASAFTAPPGSSHDKADIAHSPLQVSRVKTMQLQLDPEILGKVTIRMRLSGTRLDLRVETELPETMRLIGKETDLLTSKLQAAGYAVETLVLRQPEPQAQHQQLGVNVQSNGQDYSTGQANGDPSAHDRPSTHDGRERSRPALADDAQDGAGIRYTGGDLYL